MKKTITLPFSPGDDLYYTSLEAKDGEGPALAEIMKDEGGISSVNISDDGEFMIVQESSDKPEPPGGQWNCLSEKDAEEWLQEEHPGAILLDGKIYNAVYTGLDGKTCRASLQACLQEITGMTGNHLITSEPDEHGIVAIWDANANRQNASFATFVKDSAGNTVDAIYGPFLLVLTELDKNTGLRRIRHMTEEMLGTILGQNPGAARYDPDYWTACHGMTVAGLKKFLERLPDDAVLHCCGTTPVYLHYVTSEKAFSIDCESLDGLPEYEGHEPTVIRGAG